MSNFFKTPVLRLEQDLGVFYAAAIPAEVLLEVCYADRLTAQRNGDTYTLDGAQRERVESRVKDIAKFIGTREFAFPNSILLAGNCPEDDEGVNASNRWVIQDNEMELVIPTRQKMAVIIDGQHRLFGFTEVEDKAKLQTPLLCSIFLDLPRPYQAYLFATINSNQKPVDRSQTYELFGYNVEEEPEELWTPEKLAVFLARKLNTETGSPFHERILIAAENDFVLTRSQARREGFWMISMATIVDGIIALISSSAKSDMYDLRSDDRRERKDLTKGDVRRDTSPLRDLYLDTRDKLIHACVQNFFCAVFKLSSPAEDSFLYKTIGIQALFEVLKRIAPQALLEKDFSEEFFESKMLGIKEIDFSGDVFRNPSGSGKTVIRNAILEAIDET